MSGRSSGITNFTHSRASGILSATRRSGIGLQQKSREIGKEFAIASQGAETKVR